jgi:3-hydroxyisobutyrate dehydrogenase-like beta-hydroxyacid dehydrogenase
MSAELRVALIGYGEVGQVIAEDLRGHGVRHIAAWDLQFGDPTSVPSQAARKGLVSAASRTASRAEFAALVISAVTAAQDLAAAESVAPHLAPGAYYFDLNSVSPSVKQAAARVIAEGAGRYVEAAVMSAIQPRRSGSPMLLGGPDARGFAALARDLGFTGVDVFDDAIGKASAAKMCRSVVVKGMEALIAESLLAGRHYGVEATVLDSLTNLFPSLDWDAHARYMMSRSLQHGARRAEEMREVARTVSDAGIEPWMSRACVERQAWMANYGELAAVETLARMLDELLAKSAVSGTTRC